MNPTPNQRRAIYGVIAAANALALAFGWVNGEQAAALAASATAVLGLALAFRNVPKGDGR